MAKLQKKPTSKKKPTQKKPTQKKPSKKAAKVPEAPPRSGVVPSPSPIAETPPAPAAEATGRVTVKVDSNLLPTRLPPEGLEAQAAMVQLGAQVNLLKVEDDVAYQRGGEMLTQLKAVATRLETERRKMTAPLKERAKRIEGLFRDPEEKVEAYMNALKKKLLDYHTTKMKQLKEAQAKLLQQAEAAQQVGDIDTALALATQHTELAPVAKTTLLDTGTVQVREPWTFEVIDAGLIPREYMTLDETKVRAAVKAGMRDDVDENGKVFKPAIPGIRIFQKSTLAVGAGPLL